MSDQAALDIRRLEEDYDLECKQAAGRDGRGELPRDFWPTYSAMANTQGGVVLLGVREHPRGHFSVSGVTEHVRVRKALFDGQANRQIVSEGLLDNHHVSILEADGKAVVRVQIPRAARQQRPVYVGADPFSGTYRRRADGDYRCDRETVERMFADRQPDSRDAMLLDSFDLGDLDSASLRAYRARFRATRPDHPWNDAPDGEFLRQVGGWTVDRQSGRQALTLAGLLM